MHQRMEAMEERLLSLEREHESYTKLLTGFADESGLWHDGLVQRVDDIRNIARWGIRFLAALTMLSAATFLKLNLHDLLEIWKFLNGG